MDKKITAIVLAAAVIVAAAAAFVLLNNGGNGNHDSPASEPGKRIGEDMSGKLPSSSSRL